MIPLLIATVAGYGIHLMYTAFLFRWRGVRPGPKTEREPQHRIETAIARLGLGEIPPRTLVAAMAVVALGGYAFGVALFGGQLAGGILALFSATAPIGVARLRHDRRRIRAHRAWPSLIEEIRLLTGSLGRSVPQATFEVGARAPDGLRPAFDAAHREWLISTDFTRSLDVLKNTLRHHSADIVAETLLTAHELGGAEVGRRLAALAEDRTIDIQHRRDAVARQAGVRFARWFVLLVPLGMALAGLSIGSGRAAYATAGGQIVVAFSLFMIVGCWVWAGRIMRMPVEERVFP
ncbi:MAG: type II secretion system F family protein [Acidimicrobiales bacterium]